MKSGKRLAVAAIGIAVLVAFLIVLAIPRLTEKSGRHSSPGCGYKEKRYIRVLGAALDLYRLDNDTYPSMEQGLNALFQRPTSEPLPVDWSGPYLKTMENDSWGRPFIYKIENDEFEISSLGSDGMPGGSGCKADISSTMRPSVRVGEEFIPFDDFLKNYNVEQRLKTSHEIQSVTNKLLQAGCTLVGQDASPPICFTSPICKGYFYSVFNAKDGSFDQQTHLYEWNSQTRYLHVTGLQGFLIMPEECKNGMEGQLRWKNNQ